MELIMNTRIFVFGSNLAGRHGAGAALVARKYFDAVYGEGVGRTGDAYAIPTKDKNLKVLPISEIQKHVEDFLEYAHAHQELQFEVTRVGCGLAGYKDEDIAPLFHHVPDNCMMPEQWRN
jgi:hypothetical protein